MSAKRTKRLGAMAAALLMATSAVAQARWLDWRDPSFGTAIQYPADLFRPEAGPGREADGLVLSGPGGARLVVYGGNNVAGQTPATYLAWLRDAEAQQAEWAKTRPEPLSAGPAGPGYVTRSGVRGGRLVYEKHLFDLRAETIHVLRIDYPPAQKAVIEPLIPRLAASLRHLR